MKIVSTSNMHYDTSYRKNNVSKPQTNLNNETAKSQVSFGSLGGSLKAGSTEMFKFIERTGFFMEFLIVDTLSLVIPRILIGLNRDRDKTGQFNYQAGAEEAGREVLSGPSMNLIPMGLVYVLSKAMPASHMERGTLNGLTHNMKAVVKESADNKDLDKKLADKVFEDAFGKFNLDNRADLKTEFNKLLNEAKGLKGKEFKQKAEEFEKHIVLINNQNKDKTPMSAKVLTISTGTGEKDIPETIKAKDFIRDFKDYSKDVIGKFTKQNITKDKAEEFLKSITKKRLNLKLASAVTAFFAVGGFLLYLPKVYQRGKVSPAMKSAQRAEGGANENK